MAIANSFLKSEPAALPKEAWIGFVSSSMEAYNMAIYSFTAPYLANLMFRESAEWRAVFFSYALVFIGSCFSYPLGAIYYGLQGDKRGRQRTCLFATLGLAVTTGLMGLMPTDLLGERTWLGFLLLITAQYFFSGGEYHGSVVFSLEHANRPKNGLVSATSCLFAVVGICLANGLATMALLLESEMWVRICFLIGALGGVISYLLKNHCQETPTFAAIPKEDLVSVSLGDFIQNRWRKIIPATLILALYIVLYSFIFIFLPLIKSDELHSHHFDTFQSLVVYGLGLLLSGYWADRIGVEKVMKCGIVALFVLLPVLPYYCHSLFYLQFGLTLAACCLIGPIHSWVLMQFEPQERCRGIFISSAIATSLFAGSTVPLCLMLYEKCDSLVLCSLYPLAFVSMAFICLIGRESFFEGRSRKKFWGYSSVPSERQSRYSSNSR